MDRLVPVLAPFRRVTQPKVFGVDRIPHRPVLFVGNHTRYAFLDLPFMMSELWTRRRIVVRALGEHAHYSIPVWRDLLENLTPYPIDDKTGYMIGKDVPLAHSHRHGVGARCRGGAARGAPRPAL